MRKVRCMRSSASGRALSCTLGRRAFTDCFLGAKSGTSRYQGCAQSRQRVPCLPLRLFLQSPEWPDSCFPVAHMSFQVRLGSVQDTWVIITTIYMGSNRNKKLGQSQGTYLLEVMVLLHQIQLRC